MDGCIGRSADSQSQVIMSVVLQARAWHAADTDRRADLSRTNGDHAPGSVPGRMLLARARHVPGTKVVEGTSALSMCTGKRIGNGKAA
jgi:hypothetical protein